MAGVATGAKADETKKHVTSLLEAANETIPEGPMNLATATAVGTAFAYCVGWRGFKEGKPFDLDTVSMVGGAQMLRMTIMKLFGGEREQHIAMEELAELEHGILPVPVLVALSDITTTSLRVDATKLEAAARSGLSDNTESYASRTRPALSAGREVWQKYLERVEADVSRETTKVIALTSAIAPIATTYSSAASANDMADEVCRRVFELSYARAVLAKKGRGSEGAVIDEAEIFDRAQADCDDLMNGPKGFMKLTLTLAANVQGAAFIGDPPEIYAALNHASEDPAMLAKLHASGIVLSELLSLSLTYGYLRGSLGIRANMGTFAMEFAAMQRRALAGIAESGIAAASELEKKRKGEDFVSRTAALLGADDGSASTEAARRMVEEARRIAPTLLQLDIAGYVEKRRGILGRLSGKPDAMLGLLHRLDGFTADGHAEESAHTFADMLETLHAQDAQ